MATKRNSSRPRPSPPKTTASEVAPGVFVGGWKDAAGFQGTRFCVLDEAPDGPIPAETLVPVYDPAGDSPIRANLDRLATLAAAARRREEPVLFFCGHGVRRGPLAAAWFLHRHEGVSLEVAYDRIRAVRPQVETAKEWAGDVSVLAEARPPARR
ncbi:MAG: hypothetical protein ACHQ16_01580 [Candidatus Lutacidiplasmatales archaeon]